MNSPNANACTGCGAPVEKNSWSVLDVPATLNYRFSTPENARSALRGDVILRECQSCGLIFNRAFDVDLVRYDAAYDNRQGHSPAFMRHLESVGKLLDSEIPSTGARILEVGCGKGDFLKQLCAMRGGTGVGYDTSYEHSDTSEPSNVRFEKSYVTASDIDEDFDLVVCRHVVEHIHEIGRFIREIADISRAAGNAPVLIETPDFDWIVEEVAFWDIFYEHCNYFTTQCLRRLCELQGLKATLHEPVFGGQYQLLLVKPIEGKTELTPSDSAEIETRLETFCQQAEAAKIEILNTIKSAAPGGRWAIWGSGAKGVTLGNHFRENRPLCLVDINPDKQDGFAPASAIPICSPESAIALQPEMILCANPNYLDEIKTLTKSLHYEGKLVAL